MDVYLRPPATHTHNAVYNDRDNLFYLAHFDDFIRSLDLNGRSPVVRMITPQLRLGGLQYKYLVYFPWGKLLQVLATHTFEFPPDVEDYDP